MQYRYVPPVAESHEIRWQDHSNPGLIERTGSGLAARIQPVPELRDWLDANAQGWSFGRDCNYDDSDDDMCRIKVPSEQVGKAFLELAERLSAEWMDADRARMPHRITLERPGQEPVEIARSHHPMQGVRHERRIGMHFDINRQPGRADLFRAIHEAQAALSDMKAPARLVVRGSADLAFVRGSLLVVSVVAVDQRAA